MMRLLVLMLCFVSVLHVQAQPKIGSSLPAFSLVNNQSATFSSLKAFPVGKPLAVIYFSPYCLHCTMLLEEVAEKKTQLKKLNLLLVTSFEAKDYNTLIITRGLNTNPNIKVGTDVNGVFAKTFGFKQVPAVAVFDGRRKLKKAFETDVSLGTILRSASL